MVHLNNAQLIVRGQRIGPVSGRLKVPEAGAGFPFRVHLAGRGVETLGTLASRYPLWIELESGERIDIEEPVAAADGTVSAVIPFVFQLERLGLVPSPAPD